MNRIIELFNRKKQNVLSIYLTAGYPELNDTAQIICSLQKHGADMIEVGIPFSDPVADGPVIQGSSQKALANGMSLDLLFEQLKTIRLKCRIPLLLMGYFNPVYHAGIEEFLKSCSKTGIDGVIIPDLPMEYYRDEYSGLFEKYGVFNIMLITPQTPEKRIREIDRLSKGFIYMVSSYGTTGTREKFSQKQEEYFRRIAAMKLKTPCMIGFGVGNKSTWEIACKHARGAIIGSAFIKALEGPASNQAKVAAFMQEFSRDGAD